MAGNITNIAADWVTQTELRTYITMDNLFKTHWYLAALKRALAIEIMEVICFDQFEEINNQILTNTLTADNEALRAQLSQSVAHFAIYYGMVDGIDSRIENIGNKRNVDTTTENIDRSERAYIAQEYRNQAFHYLMNASCWIRDNIDTYPLMKSCFDNVCSMCGGTKFVNGISQFYFY